MAHALLYDQTHDNPSMIKVHSRTRDILLFSFFFLIFFFIFLSFFIFHFSTKRFQIRRSFRNHWHFPFRTKTKDLFITMRFSYFKVFTVEVESFLRPFQLRSKERKKFDLWKKPQRSLHISINFPSSQNCPSLRTFPEFWEQARIVGG